MNILIISPAFAPFSGVGAVRMSSLAKFLVNHGHIVTVLRNNPLTWGIDSLKSKELSNIQFIDAEISKDTKFKNAVLIYKKLIKTLFKNSNFDTCIISTGPYYGIFLVPYIKKNYNTRVILEQRDLWLFHYSNYMRFTHKLKHTIFSIVNLLAEFNSIKFSDKYITVTPQIKKILQMRYVVFKKKIECITNGFERNSIINSPKSSKYTFNFIAHFGKLTYYNLDDAKMLLNSLKSLRNKGVDIRLVHIGEEEEEIIKLGVEIGLPNDAIIQTGYVSYETGISIIKASLCCTIVDTADKVGYASKMFDYIGVNKPIIAIIDETSAMSKILKKFEFAYICSNEICVENYIESIIYNKIEFLGNNDAYQYSRDKRNAEYLELIKNL